MLSTIETTLRPGIVAFLRSKTWYGAVRRSLRRADDGEIATDAREFAIAFGCLAGSSMLLCFLCLCIRWVKGNMETKKLRSDFFAYQKARGAKMPELRSTFKVAPVDDTLEAGLHSSASLSMARKRSQPLMKSSRDPMLNKSEVDLDKQNCPRIKSAKTAPVNTSRLKLMKSTPLDTQNTARVCGTFSRTPPVEGEEQSPQSRARDASNSPNARKALTFNDNEIAKSQSAVSPREKGKEKHSDALPSTSDSPDGKKGKVKEKGKGKGKGKSKGKGSGGGPSPHRRSPLQRKNVKERNLRTRSEY